MRIILSVLLLAGCATQEQVAAQRQYEAQQQQAQRAAYRERVYSQCRAYGYTDNTPAFSNCLMQVDQANQQRDAATRNAILQQLLFQQGQQDIRALPYCSSLPAGVQGFRRAEGSCR